MEVVCDDVYAKYDYRITFSTIGEVNITYTGTSAVLIDSKYNEVNYESGDNIKAGVYTLYGLDISKVKFNNNMYKSIHVMQNDKQLNGCRMCYDLSKLENFTVEVGTFGKTRNLEEAWVGCVILSLPIKNLPTFNTRNILF